MKDNFPKKTFSFIWCRKGKDPVLLQQVFKNIPKRCSLQSCVDFFSRIYMNDTLVKMGSTCDFFCRLFTTVYTNWFFKKRESVINCTLITLTKLKFSYHLQISRLVTKEKKFFWDPVKTDTSFSQNSTMVFTSFY